MAQTDHHTGVAFLLFLFTKLNKLPGSIKADKSPFPKKSSAAAIDKHSGARCMPHKAGVITRADMLADAAEWSLRSLTFATYR